MLKVACIQMDNGRDMSANLSRSGALIRSATGDGAKLIATPENTGQVIAGRADKLGEVFEFDKHPALSYFSTLAHELGVWILIGSIAVRENANVFNRSLLFDDKGSLIASYDKIHLYDADLPCGESHRESSIYNAGDKMVVAHTPWGGLGMSICYDLRFAHLYRDMAKAGANIMAVPAAFTVPSGRMHWEVLLRARAIEAGAFVLAPAQGGDHDGVRNTWGHSMIIDPWGKILAEKDVLGDGVISADIDMAQVCAARAAIPALRSDRFYTK